MMLTHPTYDRLLALGFTGMAKALEEQRRQHNVEDLSFEERLGLLVDREAVERETKRLVLRLKYANLRQSAVVEDLDTHAARGLDKALFAKLANGEWIARRQDLLITGKTGTGKSWLACALGHKACRDDRSVLYYRVPRLLDALALARGDGRYPRLLKSLARVELLVLDEGTDTTGLATRPRPAGNHRRSPRPRLDNRDQPNPRQALARADRRSDHRRRHPRSPRAHLPSPRVGRAVAARPRNRQAGRAGLGRDAGHRGTRHQVSQGNKKMSAVPSIPPAPAGQQGPPARAAAFDSGGHSAARAGPSYWLRGRPLFALRPKLGTSTVANLTQRSYA